MMDNNNTRHVSVPTDRGTLWVFGSREPRWQTARFTVERDESRFGGAVVPLGRNLDWPSAHKVLGPLLGRDTTATMRSVLP